jgi:ribosomal protein L14E/L6E/L27E
MPLVLVLAPNGAVTMGCVADEMKEEALRTGIASPCQQACLKALQDNKLVVVCAYDKSIAADDPSVKAVNDFHADAQYVKLTEVVKIDPADAAEARFLKQLRVDPKTALTTVVLAPPRAMLKTFTGPITKAALEGALKSGDG